MQGQDNTIRGGEQGHSHKAKEIDQKVRQFLMPLLLNLDKVLDKRLVKTFFDALIAIIQCRHGRQGLLLSELGAYILTPEQAPAGTKRLSNLLRSSRWCSKIIEDFLWKRANEHLDQLESQGKRAFCIWDGSVLEKPESEQMEDYGPVHSKKAARLKKLRRGKIFNTPSGKPITVLGMEWTNMLLAGFSGIPSVVMMKWWTRRGKFATTQREQERSMLEKVAGAWGERVLHVFDRGYASRAWLQALQEAEVPFLIRWAKHHCFFDLERNEKKLWQIVRGKRSIDHRFLWDAKHHCERKTGIVFLSLRHGGYALPLWVVVVRRGGEPWYLITNQRIETKKDAWDMVFAYAKRWQIEMSFRYGKSELSMESPRLWKWENRLKLLFLVTLAYTFLLSLAHDENVTLKNWLLRHYCHRTGKRCRSVTAPLYRLRWALSRLWLNQRPTFSWSNLQNSG